MTSLQKKAGRRAPHARGQRRRIRLASPLHPGLLLGVLLLLLRGSVARADLTLYLPREGTWSYFPGLAEPTPADLAAWRFPDFDDSSWGTGQAPFGYGTTQSLGTNLGELDPPMRSNYSTLYLRSQFELTDPLAVVEIHAGVDFDDGFILWINGVEITRFNAPDDPSPPYTAVATRSHVPGSYQLFDETPNPQTFLRKGKNVVAVQALNATLSNIDFKIDVEVFDPLGPDVSPPAITYVNPPPGSTLRKLDEIEVRFSEAVKGVNASDLRIAGRPTDSVTGEAAGPYIFHFRPSEVGEIDVTWAPDHGITDLSERANPLTPSSWKYEVNFFLPAAVFVISELSATGDPRYLDQDGEEGDWIEVENRGKSFESLEGWALSDDPADPGKWVFPAVALDAGERVLVYASGKDRRDPSAELHTNFKLNSGGEPLGLYAPGSPREATTLFSPQYPEQRKGVSYGLDAAGHEAYFDPPTPGQPNGALTPYRGFVADPVFSIGHGYYSAPLSLRLATQSQEAKIFYTTDGTEPDPANGTLYSVPIDIAGSPARAVIPVRAVAYREGYLPSRIVTQTYLFAEHVLTQSATPAGFPTTWGTQVGDYAMDSRVIQEAGARALTGLLSIPTLSVVTSPEALFDRSLGIYSNPSRSGEAWEREVSAELIYPDGRPGFQTDCGLRVQGGSSTSDWKSIKLSLRLLFKGDYGPKKLDFPVFPGSPVRRFDSIVLDAHLNLAYTHPDHAQRVRSQFVRDIFVSDLQRAAGSLGPQGRFVHLYLDGLYWGMYDLHERPDASFSAEHLGGDKDEYDVYRHNSSTLVDGNAVAWNEMFRRARLDVRLEANYAAVEELLDLNDLADYMLVNLWAGNTDWAHQNWYASRRRVDGAGFRFFSWDAEHVLKSTEENVVGVANPGGPGELYSRMRTSEEFRLLFADHVQRHFSRGGIFYVNPQNPDLDPDHPEDNRALAMYLSRIAEIDTAVILESARWGDARRPNQPYTRDNEFQAELDLLIKTYFPRRSAVVLNELRAAALYPRVEPPLVDLPGGQIQPGALVTLALPAGQTGDILYTLDGADPRAPFTGEVAPGATLYVAPLALRDTALLKARTRSDTGWSALVEESYSVARLGDALRVAEVHYHPAVAEGEDESLLEFIELWNSSGSTLYLDGVRFTRGIDFVFPDGTFLEPQGRVVLVGNGTAFGAAHPGVAIAGEYVGSLSNGGEVIALADAAGNELLSFEYDDEGFWPRGPDGFGWSLVLADPAGEASDPLSWRASSMRGGTPGAPDGGTSPGTVWISEVLTNSAAPFEDALELYNPTAAPVDVSGWYISDDGGDLESLQKARAPQGTVLPPGGYAVIYEATFNSLSRDVAPHPFAFGSGGDDVFIASADSRGALTGQIFGRKLPALDAGISMGWVDSSLGPRFVPLERPTFGGDLAKTIEEFRDGKGLPNAAPRRSSLVLNEIHYHPSEGVEFVELYNESLVPIDLSRDSGFERWRLEGIRSDPLADGYDLPEDIVIPPRGFLLVTPLEPAAFRQLVPLPDDVVVVGPYAGGLDNGGERIALWRSSSRLGGTGGSFTLMDSVRYGDAAPWPPEADGRGPSLERTRPWAFGDEPGNWAASLLSGGTPGAPNSTAEPREAVPPEAYFVLSTLRDPTKCFVDGRGSWDPDGEVLEFRWDFGDGATGTGAVTEHQYARADRYAVTLTVRDSDGLERSFVAALSFLPEDDLGGRVPWDANTDARLNITDVIVLAKGLFQGKPVSPCGDTMTEGSSLLLLDGDGNGALNLTDVVGLANYLFLGGPPHVLGSECVRVQACLGDVCLP